MLYRTLSEEQLNVFNGILAELYNGGLSKPRYIVLDAAGGTGKTYTMRAIMDFMASSALDTITAMAYTGRASTQLAKAGIPARTCHSLLLKPIMDDRGNLIRSIPRTRNEILEECGDIIVIDEASMIPRKMHEQLSTLMRPIIYLGDSDQLPPVDPDSKEEFNVMNSLGDQASYYKLTENRRFQSGSGIEKVCNRLREQNSIMRMQKDDMKTISKNRVDMTDWHRENQFDAILCGLNKTRKKFNSLVRRARGFSGETPEIGEQVMCLRNDITGGIRISNGELYSVSAKFISDEGFHTYNLISIDDDRKKVTVRVADECWSAEKAPYANIAEGDAPSHCFGFGYSLSVHKAQGSTLSRVLFFDEDVSFFLDQRRFRYTAVSRTSEFLCVAI